MIKKWLKSRRKSKQDLRISKFRYALTLLGNGDVRYINGEYFDVLHDRCCTTEELIEAAKIVRRLK